MFSEEGKRNVANDKQRFIELYSNALKPLGAVISRTLIKEEEAESPPGVSPGIYHAFTYRTKYQNSEKDRAESLAVRGNDKQQWEMFSHQISMIGIDS